MNGNTYRVVSYSATYNCYATGAKSDFVAITQSNFNQYTLQGVTSIAQLQQRRPLLPCVALRKMLLPRTVRCGTLRSAS